MKEQEQETWICESCGKDTVIDYGNVYGCTECDFWEYSSS